ESAARGAAALGAALDTRSRALLAGRLPELASQGFGGLRRAVAVLRVLTADDGDAAAAGAGLRAAASAVVREAGAHMRALLQASSQEVLGDLLRALAALSGGARGAGGTMAAPEVQGVFRAAMVGLMSRRGCGPPLLCDLAAEPLDDIYSPFSCAPPPRAGFAQAFLPLRSLRSCSERTPPRGGAVAVRCSWPLS
ncbi:unnamed protein product, partial [Prorocentrum cordatum]